jgi:hypothetical protein
MRKGSLIPQNISRVINQIYATKENEFNCSQIQQLLPIYVEAEFEGKEITASDVEIHLNQCPDCTEIYQGMRFLIEQEAAGELDDIEEVLPHTSTPQPEPSIMAPVASSCD